MVKEMRDLPLDEPLDEIEEAVARAEAELAELKDDVHKYISNPVDALLPAAIGSIMSAVARGLGTGKE